MSLIIRAPNHLGDLVMALPALQAAKPDAVVAPKSLASLIEMAGFTPIVYEAPFKTGLALRKHKFERGILFTPSFSSAVLLKLAGVQHRRGTKTDNRGFLLNEKVDAALLEHTHRSSVYWLLATGELPPKRLTPSLQIPSAVKTSLETLLPRLDRSKKRIGVFPGSNAPARRWPPERFQQLVKHLSSDAEVVVFGGPDERELTKQVASDVAIDLGGKTTLPLLAAGLASCDLVLSNDSGPLHLAAAVGTATVSMWGAGDPARTGPPHGHTILRDRRLPCLECVKNQCPRSGPGYILPDAYMECMQLIPVEDVLTSARI